MKESYLEDFIDLGSLFVLCSRDLPAAELDMVKLASEPPAVDATVDARGGVYAVDSEGNESGERILEVTAVVVDDVTVLVDVNTAVEKPVLVLLGATSEVKDELLSPD